MTSLDRSKPERIVLFLRMGHLAEILFGGPFEAYLSYWTWDSDYYIMNIDIEIPEMIKIEFQEFWISAQCDKAVLLTRESMVRNSVEAKIFLCFFEKKK